MFKKLLLVAIAFVFMMSSSAYAANRDKEVAAFADKAIAHIEKVGIEQAYKDFSDHNGDFVKGELYVVTLDLDGLCHSHGMNARLVGKIFKEFRDTDGKLFINEIIDNIQKDGFTWEEYKWVNPVTKKIGKKRAISKMIDDEKFILIGYWP